MTRDAPLILNRDCYCRDVSRGAIIQRILDEQAATNMEDMLAERPHYFANTSVFLSDAQLGAMLAQIQAIEAVAKNPAFMEHVRVRISRPQNWLDNRSTKGVFMGYDFHITESGPRLIEINSNAGGAFIANMIEQSSQSSSGNFASQILDMFQTEWASMGRANTFKTLAIVDENPAEQYHYPDMCLAKSLLEAQGIQVVITDPANLRIENGKIYHGAIAIDVIYNRLTDFDLTQPQNQSVQQAYDEGLAVVTPAPHHHALYADKRNLITLSDPDMLASFGVSSPQINQLKSIPKTVSVTQENSDALWASKRSLFFKPKAGFGGRGAFRGAKLTRKVWDDILKGGYIAQEQIKPPLRAITVDEEKKSLKFDVRVYTYDGWPLLFAARIYQGQTTNLRTAGGGLAAVTPIPDLCLENAHFPQIAETCKLSA